MLLIISFMKKEKNIMFATLLKLTKNPYITCDALLKETFYLWIYIKIINEYFLIGVFAKISCHRFYMLNMDFRFN